VVKLGGISLVLVVIELVVSSHYDCPWAGVWFEAKTDIIARCGIFSLRVSAIIATKGAINADDETPLTHGGVWPWGCFTFHFP